MNPFRTKKFKALQRQWYQKLEKEGFEEIEDVESGRELMKVWHAHYFQTKYEPQTFLAKQEYYSLAFSFLERHSFGHKKEQAIWELHANGQSLRKIAESLEEKVCRVHKIVSELRDKMMAPEWQLELE